MNFKTYDQILDSINELILANPRALQQEIDCIEAELTQIERELQTDLESSEIVSENELPILGMRYLEFDNSGRLIKAMGITKAGEFRRR